MRIKREKDREKCSCEIITTEFIIRLNVYKLLFVQYAIGKRACTL